MAYLSKEDKKRKIKSITSCPPDSNYYGGFCLGSALHLFQTNFEFQSLLPRQIRWMAENNLSIKKWVEKIKSIARADKFSVPTEIEYSKAARYTASSCTDLAGARFWIRSKKIWDERIYVVKTLSSTVFWPSCLHPILSNKSCTNFELNDFFYPHTGQYE